MRLKVERTRGTASGVRELGEGTDRGVPQDTAVTLAIGALWPDQHSVRPLAVSMLRIYLRGSRAEVERWVRRLWPQST